MRGIVQGTPTKHLAEELGIDRSHLLKRRHEIQKLAESCLPSSPLSDSQLESDEMYQNAGEKGYRHDDPDDPPRRRANKRRGLGMTTVMVSVKSTAILMKASGLAYATSCVLFVAFTRNT